MATAAARLDAELGYGLDALDGRGLLTPYARARKGGDPRNGDVVVARMEEEITLKRYHRQNGYGRVELQPVSSNDAHSTIHIDGQSDFEISGVVVGAIIGTRRE